MRETVDVDACARRGDLAPINAWLGEHIWQYGCLYEPGELFERAAGAKFDPTYYTDYLEKEAYGGLRPVKPALPRVPADSGRAGAFLQKRCTILRPISGFKAHCAFIFHS